MSRIVGGLKPAALSVAIAAAIGFAGSSPALAQEAIELEEVVVTGSRIPTDPNLVSSTPVQSLDAEEIRISGELNLADIVSDIPALVSSLTAENSDALNSDEIGGNSLNLRGMGGARTLTLVNGRRHVAGFRGSQAVDTGTIPRRLVERVEVTTGGASAVYGADAVTGVVNFILMDDFEGIDLDIRGAVPTTSGGENYALDFLFGENFGDGRGNVVLSFTYEGDAGLVHGDRDWAANNGIDSIEVNPDFLTDPSAPPRAVVSDTGFWLTSQEGSLAPTFGGRDVTYVDINNNGIADCQESEGGRVGFLAGCWLTNPDGTVRVNQDGIVLDGLSSTGGDAGRRSFNRDTIFPETDRYVVNLNANYDVTDNLNVFAELKYVSSESTTFNELDTFYDTLFIPADNPFIPAQLQPVTDVTGGLLITQDPLDWSDNNPSVYTRETTRFVAGLSWEFADNMFLDFDVNRGTFENEQQTTSIYLDRVFAAIDSVDDGSGNIVCRSDINPTAAYELDFFVASNGFADGAFATDRYYSFTPGDGLCQPLNPFGTYSASEAAQNFVTANLTEMLELEQTVVALTSYGELPLLEGMLAGPIGFAVGIEYREESSDNTPDPLDLGILPDTTPLTPGVPVNTIDPWLNTLVSIDNTEQFRTRGEYDVTDIFAEIRVPLLSGMPFAEELSVDAAFRRADYSTLGTADTWKIGGNWTPIPGLSFRSTISEAVRAPNIQELFDPRLPITVNANTDPCAIANVGTGSPDRQANCIADLQAAGVASGDIVDASGNYIWVNPLSARFSGVSGGNPGLGVETADTFTAGVVFQPSFVNGLSITIDVWDIDIEDAISAVSAADILDGCLDSPNYPGLDFCNLYTRRGDGGLNFLETGEINFAKVEASGVDFAINYTFYAGDNEFEARLVGSNQDALDFFFNPLDPSDVNPEIGEIQRPELTGNLYLGWSRGAMSVGMQTQYIGKQAVAEVEDVLGLGGNSPQFGDAGWFDEMYVVDLNGSYRFSDELVIYGGINNVTDEEPYSTQLAWPVGPRGQTFFLGATYTLD